MLGVGGKIGDMRHTAKDGYILRFSMTAVVSMQCESKGFYVLKSAFLIYVIINQIE